MMEWMRRGSLPAGHGSGGIGLLPAETAGRYAVTIDRGGVSFRIADREELLSAFKTLRQLAESRRGVVTSGQFIIPCGEIRDEPGLSFRGIVLAVWHYHHPKEPPAGEVCWPTAAHFAAKGFPVLLCPCFDERGIITMAEQAADTGLTGMLQTTWVSYSGTSRMRQLFFVSANKMWNRAWQPERGFADEFGVVNTHLRQIVADMGLREYEQTGSIYTGYSFYP